MRHTTDEKYTLRPPQKILSRTLRRPSKHAEREGECLSLQHCGFAPMSKQTESARLKTPVIVGHRSQKTLALLSRGTSRKSQNNLFMMKKNYIICRRQRRLEPCWCVLIEQKQSCEKFAHFPKSSAMRSGCAQQTAHSPRPPHLDERGTWHEAFL